MRRNYLFPGFLHLNT